MKRDSLPQQAWSGESVGVDEEGGREISMAYARLFAVVTAAVTAGDRVTVVHRQNREHAPRARWRSKTPLGRFSVLHRDRPD